MEIRLRLNHPRNAQIQVSGEMNNEHRGWGWTLCSNVPYIRPPMSMPHKKGIAVPADTRGPLSWFSSRLACIFQFHKLNLFHFHRTTRTTLGVVGDAVFAMDNRRTKKINNRSSEISICFIDMGAFWGTLGIINCVTRHIAEIRNCGDKMNGNCCGTSLAAVHTSMFYPIWRFVSSVKLANNQTSMPFPYHGFPSCLLLTQHSPSTANGELAASRVAHN